MGSAVLPPSPGPGRGPCWAARIAACAWELPATDDGSATAIVGTTRLATMLMTSALNRTRFLLSIFCDECVDCEARDRRCAGRPDSPRTYRDSSDIVRS